MVMLLLGSAQLCVSSTYEDLGCKTINLSQYPSSPVRFGPWTFSPEIVEVGETFKVCVPIPAETFYPSPAHIKEGEKVIWNNTGNNIHTITSILSYTPIKINLSSLTSNAQG